MRRLAVWVAMAALAVLPGRVAAQGITTNDAVERLFTAEAVNADWFAPSFLAAVPAAQIDSVLQSLEAQFGELVAVDGTGGQLTTRLDHATMDTQVTLDANGRIAGLLFGPPIQTGVGIEELVAQIEALPGETALLVLANGQVAAAHNADVPLAVGSAFKLAVLAALAEAAAPGTLVNYDDFAAIEERWKSLPSGILQDWREGTIVTVAVLANLMISISDNTATDTLIATLGRESIEPFASRNVPLLTTGEMFKLKAVGNEALRQRWLDGDAAARRALLEELASVPLPGVDQLSASVMIEPEWFFTAEELCGLLDLTHDDWAFDINPGVADPADWAAVAFKGGSEPGVLNLSTRTVARDGSVYCVVATWNDDEPLNDQELVTPVAGILHLLAEIHSMPP